MSVIVSIIWFPFIPQWVRHGLPKWPTPYVWSYLEDECLWHRFLLKLYLYLYLYLYFVFCTCIYILVLVVLFVFIFDFALVFVFFICICIYIWKKVTEVQSVIGLPIVDINHLPKTFTFTFSSWHIKAQLKCNIIYTFNINCKEYSL